MSCISFLMIVSFIAVVGGSSKCTKYEFPCENEECIDAGLWCDTHKDCSDGSDEKYCKTSGIFSKDPNKCSDKYFKCKNGQCIPLVGRCDGYESCEDSSDEMNCELETSTKSEAAHSIKPASSQETRTTPKNSPITTSVGTTQTPVKLVSHASDSYNYTDEIEHSVHIMQSDLRNSNYSYRLEKARNWLLLQRKHDFGWGDETPRAIIAMFLSDVQRSSKNVIDALMVKQLEVELSLDMARNGTKIMKPTDLALYLNALLASCKDPKNFYGENLVSTLRRRVDAAHKDAMFVNPSVYLTLCVNNAITREDVRNLYDLFASQNRVIGRADIQALTMLTISCLFRNSNLVSTSTYDGIKRQYLQRTNASGLPGNVYEASLVAQALQELKESRMGLIEFILEQQKEDGSFDGILATYLALPVLSGRSFLQMNDHCSQTYKTELVPLEVLKNPKRRQMNIQYSLNYGYPPEIRETIQMKVAEGINFLDIMRLAEELNENFRFMLDINREDPVVYSIGGLPNDAERGTFWTLYLVSKNKGDSGNLAPYSGSIKKLIPNDGYGLVFWWRSIDNIY